MADVSPGLKAPKLERNRYYGKYRGRVVSNVDPMQQGRITAEVPDVLGRTPTAWAMPCVPFAGARSGLLAVPPVGSAVWIEFEQGDAGRPVWSGGWWESSAEVPAMALATPPEIPHVVVQTPAENTFMISDVPGPSGGLLLKTPAGAMIRVNDAGIMISNGKGATIALAGPTVTINEGAFTVT